MQIKLIEKLEREQVTKIVWIFLIVLVSLVISLPGSLTSGPVWPDGQRYTFNGILLHDMIRDGALFHPYQYSVEFYSRYPATNLPYGPPFFAAVFAAAFGIFGVSFSVARGVVALYTAMAGVLLWYMVYRYFKQHLLALLSVAGFLLNPLTGIYSRDITPEVPVAFYAFLTVYFFYEYIEKERKWYGLFAALAFSLGYLTKPYITPLAMAIVAYALVRRRWSVIFSAETLFSCLLTFTLTYPPTLLAQEFAKNELRAPLLHALAPLEFDRLIYYPKIAIAKFPVLSTFAVLGWIVGIGRKEKTVILSLLWSAAWYFFYVLYMREQEPKYVYTFIPSLVIPFAVGIHSMSRIVRSAGAFRILMGCIVFWLVWKASTAPVYYVRGYEDAGRYVAEHSKGKSVMFSGGWDGSFMMGIRKVKDKSGPHVLRGDRQFAERVYYGNAEQRVRVHSPEEIKNILNKYRTGYVVVEMNWPFAKDFPEYDLLVETVRKEEGFTQVQRFPIETNYSRDAGTHLAVYAYRYDESKGMADKLEIPVPTLRRSLEVDL